MGRFPTKIKILLKIFEKDVAIKKKVASKFGKIITDSSSLWCNSSEYVGFQPPNNFQGVQFFFSSCRHYNSLNPREKNFLAATILVSVYRLKIIWGWGGGSKILEPLGPIYSLRDTLKKKNFERSEKFFFYKVSLVPIII